jgi:hypothetical protein
MRTRSVTFRHLSVAIFAAVIGVSAAGVAGATAATGPTITNYKANPKQLSAAGGSVRLEADTTDTVNCEFSSSPAIKGLPTTIVCPNGHPGITVSIPANTTSKVITYFVTLKAIASNGATESQTIGVPEEPTPAKITSFTASTSKLPDTGGKLTLTGKVTQATICVISVKPSVSGLPASVPCSSGTLTKTVTVPASTSGLEVEYVFVLTVTGLGGGSVSASTDVFVAAQPPTISNFTASPSTVPAAGGTVTLSFTVNDAVDCNFGDAWTGPKGRGNPVSNVPNAKPASCTSGTFTYKATVTADTSKKIGETISFTLQVNSQSVLVTDKTMPVVHQAMA